MTESASYLNFNPAERAASETVQAQSHRLLEQPLLRRLFAAIPDMILVLNRNRQIVFANEALIRALKVADEEAVLGLRPGEALGCVHAFETSFGCGGSEFCTVCGAAQALLSSLKGFESVQECRITRPGSEALDLKVWTTPLFLDEEHFTILALKDISHENRRRALERIFFHDLLNIAGGLQGFALLLREAQPDEMDTIKQAIYDLSERLIEEITAQRELTAAENWELVVRPVPLNSLDLLKEVAIQYEHHNLIRERTLRVAPTAQSIWFISDGVLLRRVLGNMIKNALEASWPRETITLECMAQDGMIEFSIHNPNYMPREVQLQIFQRSFSTKGVGRGLGTYSIKLLTERYLQGQISFVTSPHDGTTFKARYPLKLDGE